MHQGEQGSVAQLDQEGQPQASRPRRTRIVIAAGVALALVLGSGGAAFAWNADQNEKYAAASAAWSSAAEDERRVYDDARAVLDASEGRVADDQVRQALAAAIEYGEDDLSAAGHGPDASRSDKTAAFTAWAAASERKAEEIRLAMAAVVEAQAEWELDQATAGYNDAVAALTGARDAGTGVLTGSEGKVADNAVRQALTEAIAGANVLLDVVAPAEVDDLTAGSKTISEMTAVLTTATTATTDAQAAWQAEQDRIAAEQAAAAAQAAQAAQAAAASGKPSTGKPSTTKSSSSGRGSSGGSKTGGSTAGSGSSPSSPSTGGGGWQLGSETTDDTICHRMDTAGNVWEC
jgi:hypothetical protein